MPTEMDQLPPVLPADIDVTGEHQARRVQRAVTTALAAGAVASLAFIGIRQDSSSFLAELAPAAEEEVLPGDGVDYLTSSERNEVLPSLVRHTHARILEAMMAKQLEPKRWSNSSGEWLVFDYTMESGEDILVGIPYDEQNQSELVFSSLDDDSYVEIIMADATDEKGKPVQIPQIFNPVEVYIGLKNQELQREDVVRADSGIRYYTDDLGKMLDTLELQGNE